MTSVFGQIRILQNRCWCQGHRIIKTLKICIYKRQKNSNGIRVSFKYVLEQCWHFVFVCVAEPVLLRMDTKCIKMWARIKYTL